MSKFAIQRLRRVQELKVDLHMIYSEAFFTAETFTVRTPKNSQFSVSVFLSDVAQCCQMNVFQIPSLVSSSIFF
jgi:hypothetical protein